VSSRKKEVGMVVMGTDTHGNYLKYYYYENSLFADVKKESVIHARLAKNEKGESLFDDILITDDEKYLFDKYLKVVRNDLYNKFLEYNLGVGRPIVPLQTSGSLSVGSSLLEFYLADRKSLTDTIYSFDNILERYIIVAIANLIITDILNAKS
jgi:hypothetical protein